VTLNSPVPSPAPPLRVLLVEDNPGDAGLIRWALEDAGTPAGTIVLEHVDRLSTGLERLARSSGFDVVLLDLSLPDSHGLPTLARVTESVPDTAVIVLTGLDDGAVALQAVQAGAQDYLVKGQIEGPLLARALRYARERHRLARELEAARRRESEMKDAFLSHVSHELRSPLTSIHQFVTILLDGLAGPLASEQREYLHIVLRNAEQLRAMIGDLLDVTRAGTGKLGVALGPVALPELIAQTVQAFGPSAAGKNVSLAADPVGAGVRACVRADAGRVRQVLVNLIENALKFTPGGGVIRIGLDMTPAEPGFVRVSVRDTGCGIAPDAQRRLFERLYQVPGATDVSRKGLGLGLYLCRELVAAHGGALAVESAPGRGSTFSFTLPVFQEQSS